MSKNLKKNILLKINEDKVNMHSRWFYVFGSVLTAIGIFIASALTLLSIHLLRFRLTHPGIGAARKLDFILNNLPWYLPAIAVIGIIGGYFLLKKYDFSYRKNFSLILIIIILGIIASSYVLDKLGLDNFFARRGYFRQIYMQQQIQNGTQGTGMMQRGR